MARPRSPEARRKVLDAAATLLAEDGVAALSIERVASRSGVAKTTIYRHWPDRGALIVDAVRSTWAELDAPDTGSLRGDLRAVFAGILELDVEGPASRVMPSLLDAATRDPELARLSRALAEERAQPVRDAIERAVARGELPAALDRDVAVAVVVGPLLFRAFRLREPVTAAFLDGCLDVAVAGLRASTPPDHPPAPGAARP